MNLVPAEPGTMTTEASSPTAVPVEAGSPLDPLHDPVVAAQRTNLRVMLVSAAAAAIAAVWAFWPLRPSPISLPDLSRPVKGGSSQELVALDLAAFEVPLNTIPPPPAPVAATPPPPPPPPPPSLKLQLVGIFKENKDGQPIYKAALYDPDSDRLLFVGDGEVVAGRTVRSVTPTEVSFISGSTVQTLALRMDKPGTGASNRGGP